MEVKSKEAAAKLEALRLEYLEKEQRIIDGLSVEQRLEVGQPIKAISNLSTFNANGTTYTIRPSLSVARFEQFEILQATVGYGVDFKQIFDNLKKAYSSLNAGAPADAAVILHNIMSGIKDKTDKKENAVLELCALFITAEGEDGGTYDAALTAKKINDWRAEGIEAASFFTLACTLVTGYTAALAEVLPSTSEVMRAKRK